MQGFGGQERRVAGDDQHVSRESPEGFVADTGGVGGAELLRLQRERESALCQLLARLLHLVGAAADDDDGLGDLERVEHRQYVAEQRLPR